MTSVAASFSYSLMYIFLAGFECREKFQMLDVSRCEVRSIETLGFEDGLSSDVIPGVEQIFLNEIHDFFVIGRYTYLFTNFNTLFPI